MCKLLYKNKFFISAAALLWILPSIAFPAKQDLQKNSLEQERWAGRQPTFSELDKDQDSYISKEEAKSWKTLNSKFDEVDKNGDQKIDRSEFNSFQTELIKESIKEFIPSKSP